MLMIEKSYCREIIAGLSSKTPKALISEDLWRIENNFFGPYALCGTQNRIMLDIGGRSGLYSLTLALKNPSHEVVIVERDRTRREAITESVALASINNVIIFSSTNEALSVLLDRSKLLGIVRIDLEYFDKEIISVITDKFKIDYLVGEFSEDQANPLWLHRKSREAAKAFHWMNTHCGLPMVGRAFNGPDVSVVVPAYGVEKCLDQCLESLVGQTLENIEILVVDDGAKDRSGQIADEWSKKDARVRVIHQTNSGCAASRSNGLKSAKGMFIGFVDGDDWVDPPMFQALAESAVRFTSDIAQCGYRHFYQIDNTSEDEVERFSLNIRLAEGQGLIEDPKALIPMKPSIWRRIYSRRFIQDNELDFSKQLRRFDDTPFHFMTLALAERVSVINGCYYNYRQQRPGQDIGVSDERLFVHFPIFKILKEFVSQHYTADLEGLLFKTQVASHYWASSIIDRDIRKIYLSAAKYDLFCDTTALRVAELLKQLASMDSRRAWWARSMWYRAKSGERNWLSLQNYSK
jgi:glycosyltransferase involved in cell wall biosynthesis